MDFVRLCACFFVCFEAFANIPPALDDVDPGPLPGPAPIHIPVDIDGPLPFVEGASYSLKLASIYNVSDFECGAVPYYLLGFFDTAKIDMELISNPEKRLPFTWESEGCWLYNGHFGTLRIFDPPHHPITQPSVSEPDTADDLDEMEDQF